MRNVLSCFILCLLMSIVSGNLYAQSSSETLQPRNEVIQAVMDTYQQEFGQIFPAEWNPKFKVSGVVRASMGIESDGTTVFNRSNMDLNERNWRLFSKDALNNQQNTYDPAIYSRIKVIVDASVKDAVAMHLNITVDPWSYTGKTDATTVTGVWGNDTLTIQHLFWGNNGYTVNRIYTTNLIGDGLAVSEIKVKDGKVPARTLTSTFGDTFNVPELDVDYTFQPIRELWFDFKPDDITKIRVFPMAYEDQALTTDDPLHLSNNKSWWEESPWIDDWSPGHLDTTPVPEDYFKGSWDRSLAFMTRDSDGTRLTALRGVSLSVQPSEETTLLATVATPKTLWQEYNEVTAVPGSLRVKQFLGDRAYIGTTENMHLGMVDGKIDKANYVESVDIAVEPLSGVKATAQVSMSQSQNDWLDHTYRTKEKGNAYFASLEAVSSAVDMLKTDYLSQKAAPGAGNFFKSRLYFARMDQHFESSLSNYHETRDDAFWSRHLTYYPSPYRKMPGIPGASMGEADVGAFEVGNGIDYGRNVVGWRGNTTLVDGKLNGMVDARHVTTNNNKKIEDVARTAWDYQVTDQLSAKVLGVVHQVPKTTAGVDPFVVSGDTGENLLNSAIEGGKDASLKTGAVGARYAFTDWLDLSQVWEYSNDMTLGTDNFPQGLYNSSSYRTYTENGRVYRVPVPYLYSQGIFPQAPYAYHNVFKTVLHVQPTDIWDVCFDYTRNPNKFAGQIDDNMNHIGVETSLVPNKNLGFYARYTMSRGYDLNKINQATPELKYRTYHNMFLETRYIAPKDNTFSLSYGVGPSYFVNTSATNPLLAFYMVPTLETEHIIRLSYEKKF
ncbi:MAG: hypothetical protein V2A70_02655 [Candidatus Omnitrophota bacterium]